jgi:excalibur calcium-binding domain-containing protein
MNKIISFAFLAIFVFYGFHRCSKPHPADYLDRTRERAPASEPASIPSSTEPGTQAPDRAPAQVESDISGNFACKGKTRCHQMASCEEARFYLEHCPGVEIDGDRDGNPCEDMCGH